MIGLTKIMKIVFMTILLGVIPCLCNAELVTKGNVTIDHTPQMDGKTRVNYVVNKSTSKIILKIDGREVATILPNGSAQIGLLATKFVRYDTPETSGIRLWSYVAPKTSDVEETVAQVTEVEPAEVAASPTKGLKTDRIVANQRTNTDGGYPQALDRLNKDPFFGRDAVTDFIQKTDFFSKALSESENKAQFLIDYDVEKFIDDSRTELNDRKEEIPTLAQVIVASANIADPSSQSTILSSVIDILTNRLNQREAALAKLQSEVDSIPTEVKSSHPLEESIINYAIVGVIVLVLLIWIIVAIKKKTKKKQNVVPAPYQSDNDPNNPAIVVRRRTTSILKKQSIDDVINNPEYLLLNSSDFTYDSAVRNIYIKNSCIKDVYNMYAEDLRNSNNPKEDGCMVLGRWVYDENSCTYDISLESVVFPGEDAVFKEYELNFGGKIKLRVVEKLRKLRRETNLQYDLVCWIHSHPGLGVFFSNSDDSVQMQLKHSKHPNFLIAFVVDILTSDQEMGIFTFRKDGTMNSKGDLTKMYSLEEMYKWALDSDKASFNPQNYFNILQSSKMQMPSCKGIELNNSSIIDLTQIVIEPETGIVGWAVGSSVDVKGSNVCVVSGIVNIDEKPSAGVIGVLLNLTHMSLPTIQRIIANESANISFAMVYSSRQNTVTSIPVINGELIQDENFYGEETIDDLKIWTRRKR